MGSDKPLQLPKLSEDDDDHQREHTTKVESTKDRRARAAGTKTRLERVHTYFVVLTGPMSGQMVRVPDAPIIIGRAVDAQIRISDDGVSRHHARVAQSDDGTAYLEDLGSANGTLLNGEPIGPDTRRPLHDGDKIQVGPTTILKFTMTDLLEEDFLRAMYNAANRDSLTGLYNRRAFLERLPSEFAFARRHGPPLSLLMIDIDHFKRINDSRGHIAGDAVLAKVGQMLSSTLRQEDFVARYGGEEFVVLARATPSDRAVLLAERVRARAAALNIEFSGAKIGVTVSIGTATYPEAAVGHEIELVAKADAALYTAKTAGRDRVVAG